MVNAARQWAGLIYLTILVAGVTGGAYWLAFHNAATIAELCQAGNNARADQLRLWEYVIHSTRPPPGETLPQRAQRIRSQAAFDDYLRRVLAPRNCAQRIPEHGPHVHG